MDGHAGRPLVAAGEVVGDPGDVAGEGGVDAADGVDGAGGAAVGGGPDADDEADPDGAHAAEDVRGALAGAVGEPGDRDGEDGGRDVDGHGQELGCGGCVAEFADDGWEEEGGAVEGTDNSPVHWIVVTRQLLVVKDA